MAIPRNKTSFETTTLEECLNAFVSSEVLQDVVCENCVRLKGNQNENEQSSTKTKSTFVKRVTFAKLPQLFVIHFQRLVFSASGNSMKREDRIRFPNTLVLDEYQYEHYAIQQNNNLSAWNEFRLNSSSSSNETTSMKLLDYFLSFDDKVKDCKEKESKINDSSDASSNDHDSKLKSISSTEYDTAEAFDIELNNESDSVKSNGIIEHQPKPSKALGINLDSNSIVSLENSYTNISFKKRKQSSNIECTSSSLNKSNNDIKPSNNKMSSNSIKSNSSDLVCSSSRQRNVKYKYRLNACIVHLGDRKSVV